MVTLKQVLEENGFKYRDRGTYADRWALKDKGKWIPNHTVSIDKSQWERNASRVTVYIAGKRSTIGFDYNNKTHTYKTPSSDQITKFEKLVQDCKYSAIMTAANPAPKKPRKPSPPPPALTAQEKFDNRIYRWLGEFYVCGYISKNDRQYLYYHKAGKHIQVADTECVMVYAYIRQRDLDEANLPFTLKTFEDWLIQQGIPKKARKRVKYIPPLYD